MRANPHLMTLALRQEDIKDRRWRNWSPFIRDWRRLHAITVQHPQSFWPMFMDHIGMQPQAAPHTILAPSKTDNPDDFQWLAGARFNIAECALDGLGRDPDAAAIVFARASEPSR